MTCLGEAGVRRPCSAAECLAQWEATNGPFSPSSAFMTCGDRPAGYRELRDRQRLSGGALATKRPDRAILQKNASLIWAKRLTLVSGLRTGPDRWDERFSRPPAITSAPQRHAQWAGIGRVFLCDAEVTNRRIEGDPAPPPPLSGPMAAPPETAAMGLRWKSCGPGAPASSAPSPPHAPCTLRALRMAAVRIARAPASLRLNSS